MKIITQFIPTLRPTAMSMTRNFHDAEDLIQDLVLKILLKKEYFESKSYVEQEKIAYTMLKNLFIDNCRKKKEFSSEIPEIAAAPDAEEKVDLLQVVEGMEGMNELHKNMLLMYAQGHKCPEIAEDLGLSVNTVTGSVRYGKMAVRKRFPEFVVKTKSTTARASA